MSQFCSSPAKPAKLEFTPECAQSSYMHKAWQNSYTDKKLLLHLYTTYKALIYVPYILKALIYVPSVL